MTDVDTVARARISETKTQLHQMTTALNKSIGALDAALRSVERIYLALEEKNVLHSELIAAEVSALQQARGEFTTMALYLR